MGLQVFISKNSASREYELDFFDSVSDNLTDLFFEHGFDGVLLGHPIEKDGHRIGADAILYTPNVAIIFDFKNYGDHIIDLPPDKEFDTGKWEFDGGKRVDGGYSENPYAQLRKKQPSVGYLLKENYQTDISVKLCVIFQGKSTLSTPLPGRVRNYFFVANSESYLDTIKNMINLQPPKQPFHDFTKVVELYEVQEQKQIIPRELQESKSLEEKEKQVTQLESEKAEIFQNLAQAQHELNLGAEHRVKTLRETQEYIDLLHEELRQKDGHLAQANNAFFSQLKHESEVFQQQQEVLKQQLALESEKTAQEVQKTEQERLKLETAQMQYSTPQYSVTQGEVIRRPKPGNRKWVFITIVLLVLIAGSIWLFLTLQESQQQADRLRADMEQGITCIPLEQVSDFIGANGVCVTFVVNIVGESDDFVFLNDKSFGNFTAVVRDKSVLTLDQAKNDFLYKQIEVRGTITTYKDKPQINVNDIGQLKVVQK
ncbi:MAG: hypothetical protein WBA28_03180 [Microbacteriaceae bacterium]